MLVPPRSYAMELLDVPGTGTQELRTVFRELGAINRWLGGRRALEQALGPVLGAWPAQRPLEILDVGTGGGDLPVAMVRLARRLRLRVRVTALDRDGRTAAIAAEHARAFPEIHLVAADAFHPPFGDHAFDFTTASLFLHHFHEDQGAQLLARFRALSREAVIVNELRRHVVPWQFIRAATRLARCHPMIRHDGPLSVLRGFTCEELTSLAHRAGSPSSRVKRCWPYRIVLTLPGGASARDGQRHREPNEARP